MDAQDLCVPVRGALARVLGAWDRGDRDAAAFVSAQLLADLSVLAKDNRFQSAFENVLSKSLAPDIAESTLAALKSSVPLCVWSMVAAMNEVMKS